MYLTPDIEILNPAITRRQFRSALFDFDGTLSLIREGWPQVMIPMMVRILRETDTTESDPELHAAVEEFVMQLNGRQTIYQMIRLADELRQRGGSPLDPIQYKKRYHDLLMQRIQMRIEDLACGRARPSEWTVPGSHDFLAELQQRGLALYLASGTDLSYVRREAELLELTRFFGEHVFGAVDDYKSFSKKLVIERILQDHDLSGEQLLVFGDGFVEIEEIKRVGGVAIGVASDEVNRRGINPSKRERLMRAGADVIIPDYRDGSRLIEWLFDSHV